MTALELQAVGLGRLLLAAVLSALIGWEREHKDRPAGLRTHMTVGVSAAGLMVIADLMVAHYPHDLNLDPIRVLEAVVAGIAFLGAGTIIVHRGAGRVGGLTTAASLLATATLGVATGMGAYLLAVGATVILLLILAVMRKFTRVDGESEVRAEPEPSQQPPQDRGARPHVQPSPQPTPTS